MKYQCYCYLRHDNDAEVQPVPWISQEGERHYTESSREYLYRRLESVNASESIPENNIHGGGRKCC